MSAILTLLGLKAGLLAIATTLAFPKMIAAEPLETGFTYQGRLLQSGEPANGLFDLQFELFDALSDGISVGPQITSEEVSVSDGRFSTALDFGSQPFSGEQLWLQIGVRNTGSNMLYQLLDPRQKFTAVPYALHAEMVALDAVGGAQILDGSIGGIDVDITELQSRISGGDPNCEN